jgi:hypothetical protein
MTEFLRFELAVDIDEDEDLPALLRRIAERMEVDGCPAPRRFPVLDANGNRVGSALLDEAAL